MYENFLVLNARRVYFFHKNIVASDYCEKFIPRSNKNACPCVVVCKLVAVLLFSVYFMIGSLHGVVSFISGSSLLIDVHGVGYKVYVPTKLINNLHIGQEITVYTYLHVREDVLDLFGFSRVEELRLFELLIGVNGVGPKTALGIFSIGTKEQIIAAIQKADVKFFTAVPRLGTKNAQKIIIELKNKLGSLGELDLSGNGAEDDEVMMALKTFGFSQKEAQEALNAIGSTELDSKKKIKLALKYLGK